MAGINSSASRELCSSSNICTSSKLNNFLFTYEWRVESFIDFINRQYEIQSQEFLLTDGSTWNLVLSAKRIGAEGSHLAVNLVKLSKDGKSHSVKHSTSLVADNSDLHSRQMGEKIFRKPLDYDNCLTISYERLVEQKILQRPQRPNLTIRCEMDILLVDNTLGNPSEFPPSAKGPTTFHRNLSVPSSTIDYDVMMEYAGKESNLRYFTNNLSGNELATSIPSSASQNVNESLSALSNDLESLYLTKKLTDVEVVAEGISMSAHIAILAARSDFFSTLNTKGQICVSGIRSTVMEEVLYHMYSGKTHTLTVYLALDLIRAAKRFGLKSLQKLTGEFLSCNIELDNVLDVLEVADELQMDDIKHICLKFVSHNSSELVSTDKWKVALKKSPRVAGHVLFAIASVQKPNIF